MHTATDDLAYDRLCAGRADVVETVRPMAAGERAVCDAAGLEVVTLPVASEATTVVVAGGSGPAGCLSQQQLAGLLADPPTITSWAQLGAGETPVQARSGDTSVADRLDWLLGTAAQRQALADLPRRTRVRAAFRARLSELRAAEAAAPTARARARVRAQRARLRRQYDGVAARHDAAVAARVAADARRGRVVVLPYADYTLRRDLVTALEIGGSSGRAACVAPDDTTIAEGDYPLTRPVLLTTTRRSYDRPEVTTFLRAVLGDLAALTGPAGLVPAPEPEVERLLDRLGDGTGAHARRSPHRPPRRRPAGPLVPVAQRAASAARTVATTGTAPDSTSARATQATASVVPSTSTTRGSAPGGTLAA